MPLFSCLKLDAFIYIDLKNINIKCNFIDMYLFMRVL